VNPDGSGKMTEEMRVTLPQTNPRIDPNEESRKTALNLVKMSEGVAAWKDVTFSGDKDGKMTIKMTAYFKEISKFKVAGENISIRWKPVADNAVQMEFVLDVGKEPAPAEAPKLTEEEIARKIAQAKEQFNRQLPRLTELFKDLSQEWDFTLPGAPEKILNFEKVAGRPNSVRLVIEGPKLLDAIKTLSNDDACLRAKVLAGEDPAGPPDIELLTEKLFGTRGPIAVTFKPGDKPLFDFAAESEAARNAMPEVMRELQETAAPAATK
jgi:hypothetical protein